MKWLINPFERIAGWQALFIGLVVMALTAVVGKINQITFDGVLDVHVLGTFSFWASFTMQAVNFITLFLTMWLAGTFFSKSKLRAIDVAGTMALARTPMLLMAIICFFPVVPADLYDIPRLVVFALCCTLIIIWMIGLMYNAYAVSCNMKGGRAILSFIGALFIAEVVSKLVLFFLMGILFTSTPATGATVTIPVEHTEIANMTIRQKTENVVMAFEQGNTDAIPAYFDETMKKGLSANALKLTWIQLNFLYGKFEKADMDGLEETSSNNNHLVIVPFYFQKEKRHLQLAFNSQGEISGLYIR